MSRTSAIIVKGSPAVQGKRTYIVFGDMRGGTTMIGGVMRGLGIFLGENVNEDNQESFQFNGPSRDQMRHSIQTNNKNHDIWGWKYPHAADYLDSLWDDLRNPHLICVFRDGVANARGLNRWHPIGKVQAMQQTMLRQQQNLNMVALRNCPSILISYEKAERHKEEFLKEFSELLGIEADHSRFDFRGFMRAESYKKLKDFIIAPPEPEPEPEEVNDTPQEEASVEPQAAPEPAEAEAPEVVDETKHQDEPSGETAAPEEELSVEPQGEPEPTEAEKT